MNSKATITTGMSRKFPTFPMPPVHKQYRKRPVVISAAAINQMNIDRVAKWCGGTAIGGYDIKGEYIAGIHIPTLEGIMFANLGDYVIEGVQGEFYSCRQSIFLETYEEVAAE